MIFGCEKWRSGDSDCLFIPCAYSTRTSFSPAYAAGAADGSTLGAEMETAYVNFPAAAVARCSKPRHTKKSCDSQVAMQTFVAFLLNPRVHKTHLGQFENAKFRTQGTPTCKTDNVLHLMEAHGGTWRHCIRSCPPGLANVRTSELQTTERLFSKVDIWV